MSDSIMWQMWLTHIPIIVANLITLVVVFVGFRFIQQNYLQLQQLINELIELVKKFPAVAEKHDP